MHDIDLDSALAGAVTSLVGMSKGDPDTLAAKLEAAGIRGVPQTADMCPLVNWLSARLNGATLWVSGNWVHAERAAKTGLQEAYLDTPDVLQDFIMGFDNGRYPGLVLGGPDV